MAIVLSQAAAALHLRLEKVDLLCRGCVRIGWRAQKLRIPLNLLLLFLQSLFDEDLQRSSSERMDQNAQKKTEGTERKRDRRRSGYY